MHEIPTIIILTVIAALIFDYTNGFHDTANAIATVVSTRVLPPRGAIIMAVVFNFLGAFLTTNVAKTVADGLIYSTHVSPIALLAAILGAIIWNLITWRFGLPSSSSHALIGGMVGGTLVNSGTKGVIWEGIRDKVVIPMVISPIASFILSFIVMTLVYIIFARKRSQTYSPIFQSLQLVASAFKALSHGQTDAQKTMGVITLTLVSGGLYARGADIPLWVIFSSAAAIALGTAVGGWRIIQTVGTKISKIEPVHGFAADSSAAAIIFASSFLGIPISTTQVVSGSIFGVGAAKRFSGVRWRVGQQILIAWILTFPAAALLAAITYGLLTFFGIQ